MRETAAQCAHGPPSLQLNPKRIERPGSRAGNSTRLLQSVSGEEATSVRRGAVTAAFVVSLLAI